MTSTKPIVRASSLKTLNHHLSREGLRATWLRVLATHLAHLNRPELRYVLKQPEFKKVRPLDEDVLAGLSIGEISVLYEYSLAYVQKDKRKSEGQFFTPDDIAQVLARQTGTFPKNKVWVDPCSGVGNLAFWLVSLQHTPEVFIRKYLYLIDIDALALLIARTLFTIAFQKNDKTFFASIKGRFIQADFLASKHLPSYDFALLNPPYVVVPADKRFATADARDRYAYFLERTIETTSGFVSITPQTFTHGDKFFPLRKLLLERLNQITVYCFDNVPDSIFRGVKFGSTNTNTVNSTRAGIIVAKKGGAKKFMITPLLRWRTSERTRFLASIESFLVEIEPKADIFPKVSKSLVPLYRTAKRQKKSLLSLIAYRPTPWRLIVPSTPRYFISALKRPVSRASFKTLYFFSEEDRDLAYLLLNSSYMYWWWRVNDGGMTISERTLLSLPLFDNLPVSKRLVAKIEASERTNRVVKRNAGKDNENVKHDVRLVHAVTKALFPKFADRLAALHANSVL